MSIDVATEGYKEPGTRERFQNLLNEQNEIYGFENPWKKKDGTIVYLRESAKAYRDSKSKLLYYEGTVEDITERVSAEKKLKEYSEELKMLNASKDKFFSIIAHDLKSPFAAVLGYAEILNTDLKDMSPEEVDLYTSNLYKVSENTFNLLQNLLEWSRLQTGRVKYDPHRFKLYNIAMQVIELFKEPAKEKNILLDMNVDQYCIAFGDENMISTVIRNLTSNAIKFTNENGQITLSAKEKDEFIEIAVIDNGVGMKPEDLEKLFKIDVHHTTIGTKDEKGTGLGLILCKELVETNGGMIWAESKPGEGSKFIFTLPKDEGALSTGGAEISI
jgi:signal transduction histidine kinase